MQRTDTALKRVIVPLDGSYFSEQAIPYAQQIAGQDAELVLLQVAGAGEAIRGFTGRIVISSDEMTRAHLKGSAQSLERAQQAWLGEREHVRRIVEVGDPAEQVIASAEREHADLIVLATHGYGAVRRWVIGSVADRIVRTATMPVMVIHPSETVPVGLRVPTIERLVVPYDGSQLAAQALPFARRLALNLKIPVRLIKVTEMSSNLQMAAFYGVAVNPELYDEVMEEAQADDREILASVARDLRSAGVVVEELIVDGPIAESIATCCEPTDLIVMASHGRGGWRRMVLGSVAEKLVRQGPVPVVLVPVVVPVEARASLPNVATQRVPVLQEAGI